MEKEDPHYVTTTSLVNGRLVYKHLIAYRDVTLYPKGGDGTLYTGIDTVGIPIDHGSDYVFNLTVVYAENIYIRTGSTFSFPGKSLIVIAKKVTIFEGSGDSVIFDLSGAKGTDQQGTADTAGSGSDGYYSIGRAPFDGVSRTCRNATAGGTPSKGKSGGTGSDAGKFYFYAQLVNSCSSAVTFAPKCNGGQGGFGQVGGTGGTGGSGWSSDFDFNNDNKYQRYPDDSVVDAAAGGKGGSGGDGGEGGRPGEITLSIVPHVLAKDEKGFNFLTVQDCLAYGAGGAGGKGGSGGLGGARGHYNQWFYFDPTKPVWGKELKETRSDSGGDGNTPLTNASDSSSKLHHWDETAPWDHAEDVWSVCIDLQWLQMLMARLRFEHQIVYATQFAVEGETTLTGPKEKIRLSSAWIAKIAIAMKSFAGYVKGNVIPKRLVEVEDVLFPLWRSLYDSKDQETARNDFATSISLFLEAMSERCNVDQYTNSLAWVPQLNIIVPDVDKEVAHLESLEATRATLKAALGTLVRDQQLLQRESAKLIGFLGNYEQQRQKLVSDQQDAWAKIGKATQKVEAKKIIALNALDKKNAGSQMAISMGGTLDKALGALSTVLMFVAPEAKAVSSFGGAISIGSSFSDVGSTLETSSGETSAKYLKGQFLEIKADIDDASLQGEIKSRVSALGVLTASGGDEAYVNAVLVERAKFKKLCNSYFAGEDNKVGKEAFDKYVEAAQAVHKAVQDFNRAAVGVARLDVDKKTAKAALAAVQNGGQDNNLQLWQLYQFYDAIYLTAKINALASIYSTVRALNSLTLSRNTIMDPLIRFGSWEKIGAQELRTALTEGVTQTIKEFRTDLSTNQLKRHTAKGDMNDSKYSLELQEIRDGRTEITIDVDEEFGQEVLGIHENWVDIRCEDVRVFLVGATDARVELAKTEISLSAEHSGSMLFRDLHSEKRTFETGACVVPTTYIYTYSGVGDYVATVNDRNRSDKANLEGLQLGNDMAFPLRSVYGSWKVSWNSGPTGKKEVETKQVTGIHIEFDIAYRLPLTGLVTNLLVTVPQDIPTKQIAKHRKHHAVYDQYDLLGQHLIINDARTYALIVETTGLRGWLVKLDPYRPLRDSNTPFGTQVDKFVRYWLPSQFTNVAKSNPDLQAGLTGMGSNFEEQAANIAQTPDHKALKTYLEKVVLDIDEKATRGTQRFNTSVRAWDISTEGHNGSIGGVLQVGTAKDLVEKSTAGPAVLRSFAQEGIIIPPNRAQELLAKGRAGAKKYLIENSDKLRAEGEAWIASGKPVKGCYALLGKNAMVAVAGLETHEFGDWKISYLVAATTKIHAVDGVNIWTSAWNKNRPGELLWANKLVGKHNVRGADQVNLNGGMQLMEHTWETVPYRVEADATGKSLEAILQKHGRNDILDVRRRWKSIDKFAGTAGTIMRTNIVGGNMNYSKFDTTVVTMDSLGKPGIEIAKLPIDANGSLQPGLEVGGISINPLEMVASQPLRATDDFLLNDLPAADIAKLQSKVRSRAEPRFSETYRKQFKLELSKWTTHYTATLGAADQLSTPALKTQLYSHTDFMTRALDAMAKLTHNLPQQVAGEMGQEAGFAGLADADRLSIARDVVLNEIVGPATETGGMVDLIATEQIVRNRRAVAVGRDDLDRAEATARAKVKKAETVAEQAAETRRKALGVETDAEIEKLEKILTEALEELDREEKGREGVSELKDLRDHGDVREQAIEKERRDRVDDFKTHLGKP